MEETREIKKKKEEEENVIKILLSKGRIET